MEIIYEIIIRVNQKNTRSFLYFELFSTIRHEIRTNVFDGAPRLEIVNLSIRWNSQVLAIIFD